MCAGNHVQAVVGLDLSVDYLRSTNYLHQGLNALIAPDPLVASLFHTRATLGNSP
jgi:hypothetical protein